MERLPIAPYLEKWRLPQDIVTLVEERVYHDLDRIEDLANFVYEEFLSLYVNLDFLDKPRVIEMIREKYLDHFGHNLDEMME